MEIVSLINRGCYINIKRSERIYYLLKKFKLLSFITSLALLFKIKSSKGFFNETQHFPGLLSEFTN